MSVRYTIQDMKFYAQAMDGKCLSKEYIDKYSTLTWKCKRGHVFVLPFANVYQGGWCNQCAKDEWREEKLALFQSIAGNKGGKCLSTHYINSVTKLRFQCENGHRWLASPYNVYKGSWCRTCSYRIIASKLKHDGSELKKIAERLGGKLLSENYVNSNTKMRWQCSLGHIWETMPIVVKKGSWCPKCRKTGGAAKRKTGIAIYRQMAEEKGGKLLSETYIDNRTSLTWQCDQGHTWNNTPTHIKRGQWCRQCMNSQSGQKRRTPIAVFVKIAEKRGGKLLSETYDGSHARLTLQCKYGHTWSTTGACIKAGHWCTECGKLTRGDNQRHDISIYQKIAKSLGGKLLSEVYVNALTKLTWQCKNGHIWNTKPSLVKMGRWCPRCAININTDKQRTKINTLRKLAKSRGGKLLSDSYLNAHAPVNWECGKGHVWSAKFVNVRHGTWCPVCSKEKRKKSPVGKR